MGVVIRIIKDDLDELVGDINEMMQWEDEMYVEIYPVKRFPEYRVCRKGEAITIWSSEMRLYDILSWLKEGVKIGRGK